MINFEFFFFCYKPSTNFTQINRCHLCKKKNMHSTRPKNITIISAQLTTNFKKKNNLIVGFKFFEILPECLNLAPVNFSEFTILTKLKILLLFAHFIRVCLVDQKEAGKKECKQTNQQTIRKKYQYGSSYQFLYIFSSRLPIGQLNKP